MAPPGLPIPIEESNNNDIIQRAGGSRVSDISKSARPFQLLPVHV